MRCARGVRTRGGGQSSGAGLDEAQRPGSQQRQAWQRSAVAVDGVEAGTEEAEVAEDGWGEQKGNDSVSYARMLKFILPTLGIWLASPIMSLVDAGVVGEFSSGKKLRPRLCYSPSAVYRRCPGALCAPSCVSRCIAWSEFVPGMYVESSSRVHAVLCAL